MKIYSLLIVGIFLSFFGNAESYANSCTRLFSNSSPSKFKELTTKDLKVEKGYGTEITVKVTSRIQDEHGLSLLVLNKTGSTWYSIYSPERPNYQGDARWFPMLMGANVGYYFGFRKISDKSMTAPTAETLNIKIEEINKKLIERNREPIEARFYEAAEKTQSDFEYLNRILLESSFPMATSGHYAIHDIAYHSQSILLSKRLLDQTKIRIKLLMNLKEKFDTTKELDQYDRRFLERRIATLARELTTYIDWGTGNLGHTFVKQKKSYNPDARLNDTKEMEIHVRETLLNSTKNLFKDIERTFKISGTTSVQNFFKSFFAENKELMEEMNIKDSKKEDVRFVWDRIEVISEVVNNMDKR